MRTLFLALLLANVTVAAWLVWRMPSTVSAQGAPTQSDPGVPTLQLLSERGSQPDPSDPAPPPQRSSAEEDGETTEDERDAVERALACYTLGPLPSRADLRRAKSLLQRNTVRTREREVEERREIGHWVYLPAVDTRDRALEIARQLSDYGVRDYYVVTAGDQENTISLGLYRNEDNAVRRRRNLRELGFDARMKIRTEAMPAYYLDYAHHVGSQVPWREIAETVDDAERREIPCF